MGLIFLFPEAVFGRSIDLPALFDEAPSVWIPVVALQLIGLAVLVSADYVRGRARTDAEARAVVLAAAPVVVFSVVLAGAVVLFPDQRWERLVPAGVLLAGAALLAATLKGGARAFVAPAVVAVVLGASVTAAGTRLEGGVGDASFTTTDATDGSLVVRRAVGDVTVDLRRLDTSRPVTVVASVGMGELRLGVPDDVRLTLDARVGSGSIRAGIVNRKFLDSRGLDATVAGCLANLEKGRTGRASYQRDCRRGCGRDLVGRRQQLRGLGGGAMNGISNRYPALALSASVLVAGVLMVLDQADLLRLGWSWAVALACLTAGLGLLVVAPSSAAQYVGTLTWIAGPRQTTLWGARAATVAERAGRGHWARRLRGPVARPRAGRGARGRRPARLATQPGHRPARPVLCRRRGRGRLSSGQRPAPVGSPAGLRRSQRVLVGGGVRREHRKGALALAGIAALLWFAVGAVGTSGGPNGELIAAVAAGAGLAVLVLAPRWVRR